MLSSRSAQRPPKVVVIHFALIYGWFDKIRSKIDWIGAYFIGIFIWIFCSTYLKEMYMYQKMLKHHEQSYRDEYWWALFCYKYFSWNNRYMDEVWKNLNHSLSHSGIIWKIHLWLAFKASSCVKLVQKRKKQSYVSQVL